MYVQIWLYFSNPSSSDHNLMVLVVALNWWRQDVRKVDFSERSNPDCPARPIAMHSRLRLFLKSDVSFYNFIILCKGTSIKESLL